MAEKATGTVGELNAARYLALVQELETRLGGGRGWQTTAASLLGVDPSYISKVRSGAIKVVSPSIIERAIDRLPLSDALRFFFDRDYREPALPQDFEPKAVARGLASKAGARWEISNSPLQLTIESPDDADHWTALAELLRRYLVGFGDSGEPSMGDMEELRDLILRTIEKTPLFSAVRAFQDRSVTRKESRKRAHRLMGVIAEMAESMREPMVPDDVPVLLLKRIEEDVIENLRPSDLPEDLRRAVILEHIEEHDES